MCEKNSFSHDHEYYIKLVKLPALYLSKKKGNILAFSFSLNQTCCVNVFLGPGAFPSLCFSSQLGTIFFSSAPTSSFLVACTFCDSSSIRFLKSSRKLPSFANVFVTLEAPECSNFVLELVEELDSSLPEPRTDAILNSTKGAQGFVGFLAKKREIGASATVFLLGGGGYRGKTQCA